MVERADIPSVDDLQYDWPPNVLRYEQRFLFGLTVTDLLVIAGCMILPMMLHILLGLLGGLMGLLLGIGIARGLHWLFPALPVHTPWLFAVLAELTAISIGLAAGVVPAMRAAKLDPVEALHAE